MYFAQGTGPVPIVQGQLVPPEVEAQGSLPRTGTGALVSRFRNMGKFVLVSGLCSTNFYLLICAVYVWFSLSIPDTCNVQLSVVFLGLGLLNGAMGFIMACFVCVAQTMLSAMAHAAIAAKYEAEGRLEESSSEESDYETEARLASRAVYVPTCLYLVVMNGLLMFWTYGVFQALQADDFRCGGAGFIFWVLFVLNFLNCCLSSASGSASYQAPSGRLLA